MNQVLLPDNEFIWDIEVAGNLFLVCGEEVNTQVRRKFEISPWLDERRELLLYLRTLTLMTGFNTLRYDYPMLHKIINILSVNYNIRGRDLLNLINKWNNELIHSQDIFSNEIRNPIIKQQDLFRIHHFDNRAKTTGLKGLEFVMRMDNIQELPYKSGAILTKEQIEETVYYCFNDIDATKLLKNKYTMEMIEMREKLSPKYGIDFMNYNDVKIGESIFIKKIELKGGRHLMYTDEGKVKNTSRDQIVIKDILSPLLSFTSPQFKTLFRYFSEKVMTQVGDEPILNGALSKLQIADTKNYLGDYYVEELKKEKVTDENKAYLEIEKPLDVIIDKKGVEYLQYQKSLNIIFNDKIYYYGNGGIHMSTISGVYEPEEDEMIVDLDVEGYYPSESFIHRFEPEHLKGYYADTHGEIKVERKQYPKKTPENTGLKLAGNGTYGKGNSKYSPLRDPQYVAQTCINGQLFLTMLIERLTAELSYTNFLQANTDGFTLIIKKTDFDKLKSIVTRWENHTKLVMEYNFYSKMVINDVNNYIASDLDDNRKHKGLFVYKKLELHKNWSQLVVPQAIEAYFFDNILPEQFIAKHEDLYDFFKRTKLQKSHTLIGRTNFRERIEYDRSKSKRGKKIVIPEWDNELIYQNLSRYYVAKNGVSLFKLMPPTAKNPDKIRVTAIEAGKSCVVTNRIGENTYKEMKLNLDYDYYVNEAYKVIRSIEAHQHIETEEDGEE